MIEGRLDRAAVVAAEAEGEEGASGMAVTNEAIMRIKAMITSGELSPGDRLPAEKELGEHLGVSRNSLREAVKALELVRVLDVRRGDGTYVTSLEPGLIVEVVGFLGDLHRDESVVEMLEVRSILEAAAAARAAARMSSEDVAALYRLVEEASVDADVTLLVANDEVFHRTIAGHAGNTYLASMLEGLSANTHRARIWRGLTEQGAVARTLDEHRRIAEAIASGDPDGARSAAMVHVAGVVAWLRRSAG